MKPGMIFIIARDIISAFTQVGVLLDDGSFVKPTAQQDALLIARVNAILQQHGVTEPPQVQAVIAMLPLIFQLAGLK